MKGGKNSSRTGTENIGESRNDIELSGYPPKVTKTPAEVTVQ